ncbi:MAG: 4'-phosphopantetheinyl transferase superfamily protein, partial [Gemmobacter sp.]|nr:4'-phosphopantetheinyl transferase superfamily protein [Gemmobacter sp.]
AVPVGQTRAPVWPSGIVGSITHSDGLALAVLAPARQCAGLGFDAEPDAPFPEDLIDSITRAEERRWLATQREPLCAARMIFVAKEAAYKCQFPASQAVLGFDALRIGFNGNGGVEAVFAIPVPPFAIGHRLRGRIVRGAGLVMAGFSRAAPAGHP